jgi:RNA polymerase sigma-70 factor (family 1)
VSIIPPDKEKLLLLSIAAGDQLAYTRLYNDYAPEVFNAAMVYLRNETEAGEVVQEVFLKIWQKRESLPSIDSFKNYLFILARNKIYDGFKRKTIEETALANFLSNSPSSTVDDTDHRLQDRQYEQLLISAIDGLSPARRKIYLARGEGRSYDAIAAEYNISVSTAKKQMTQARRFVQEFILRHLHLYAVLLKIFLKK